MTKRGFVDFHTHTILSDGELLPSELVQRATIAGCRGLAITDHADVSNIDFIISRIVAFVEELGGEWDIPIIPGVELTHVPPRRISDLVQRARKLGAKWVVVHGETIVEPVEAGTNRAALEAGVDMLAHPGLITEEEASLAAQRSVYLEITTRKGHSLSNGWVSRCAALTGAPLLLNTDAHSPEDILSSHERFQCAIGAGISQKEVEKIWESGFELMRTIAAQGDPE
jgi:histidinol phosphatase-like PHP family hydrolase